MLIGGWENRSISNFGPKFGIENRGGAVGETMGVSSNRGGSTTAPISGHEV